MPRSTRQFIDERTGFMSPSMFEETVELLFATKKEFSAFTGISQAQVQRYTAGVSAIPKSVALLVLTMGMLKRRGIPLPDLEEMGVVVHLSDAGVPAYSVAGTDDADPAPERKRPGRKRKDAAS